MIKFDPDKTLTIDLYWSTQLKQRPVFDKLWNAAGRLPIAATRFGTHNPMKYKFDADSSEPFRLFAFGSSILFGDKKRVDGRYHRDPYGLGHASVFVSPLGEATRWVDWVCSLCADVAVLFGRAVSLAERERKHHAVTEYQQGRRHFAVGDTLPELYDYLPGVYWLTVLGPELTSSLDVARARQLDGVEVREVPGNQTAILTSASPFDDADARGKREREVAAALGDDHFFDRERMNRTLRPVPAFAAAMATMRQNAYNRTDG